VTSFFLPRLRAYTRKKKTACLVLETPIFVAQAVCHAQGVRFNESKMLSKRKNFDWAGSSFGRRYTQRVVFSLPRVVKTLR
jgi:hypothetical protein